MAFGTIEDKKATEPILEEKGKLQINVSQDANGFLIVELRPRKSPSAFATMAIFAVFCLVCFYGFHFMLTHPHHGRRISPGVLRAYQALDIIVIGYVLAAFFTWKRSLTLSLSKLEIRSFLLGICTSCKSFACSDVRDLRYDQWKSRSQNKTVDCHGIRFEVGSATHTFGTVSPSRAAEVIRKVREICPSILRADS